MTTMHDMTTMRETVPRTHRHGWWWKALLVGLVLWAATVGVTALTLNANLIPTLILIGSFLVPFCVVLFAAERVTGNLTAMEVLLAFVVSGIFGVLGASLLEADLAGSSIWTFLVVGLIEELVKAVILVVIGWRVVPKTARQGALLGATVGAGFAAFESAGYAFNAALTQGGISLSALLQTEILRAMLTPVSHVLWTALIGAVLFGAARSGSRYRLTLGIIGTYLAVAILHALWDSMGGIASLLALVSTGAIVPLLEFGTLPASAAAEVGPLTTTFYVIGLIILAAIGLLFLWLVLRRDRSRDAGVDVQMSATPAQTH